MLRGNSPAKVDSKGRIKIPNVYRKYIEEKYGRECYVTSPTGEFARVYPMPVWIEIEKKLASGGSMKPAIMKFKKLVSFYGQAASLDTQGRLLIHPRLRKSSGLDGEVSVLGYQKYLDIWDTERLEATLPQLTDEEQEIVGDTLDI